MDEIRIDGLTADEWEGLASPQAPTNEQLGELGIMQGQPQQAAEAPNDSAKPQKAEREDYEDLGYWQTVGDELTAGAVELSKFFVPKKYELDYTPRTRAGEAYQTFSKYLYGIGGLLMGGEVAGIAKAGAVAKGMTGVSKVAGGLETVLKGNKFFKTSQGGMRALGVKGLNIGTQGVLQGAILDATIHDADEGRMVDLFGDTNNAFIDWLQTDENDSEAMGKFKNVVDGALFSVGINGVFSAAEPILGRVFRNMKSLKEAIPEAAEPVQQEIAKDMSKLEKIANTSDLVDTVKSIKQEAEETGADASQMVADRLHTADIEDGQAILKTLDEGEDIFVHSDGTWDIKINSWEDAYKTTEEGYRKQLEALDEINGESNVGNTAINHQDTAVRDTWVNRGWIGENEELTQANANKIAKNYQDKWQIDNNVKVEFVDGLKVKGEAVDGTTSATTYQGKAKKPTKAAQTKIDKKKLEIQKIQDQITQLEGGNGEISDPLDVLKEKLRIANNELKDLTNIPQPKKLTNITIKIDKNARNPYATLRSELEHSRDIAKGEAPKEGQHFSRYNGANEGEVASGYTYKKSVGRNNALQNDMNSLNSEINNVQSEVNQHFETWYNDKTSESTVGKLLEHPAFKEEGLLDDVADVKVKHSPSNKLPMETDFNNTTTMGGYTTIENGEVVIYTNSDLPPEIVESELYHELQHARELNDTLLNPNSTLEARMEAQQGIQEVMDAVAAGDYETYKATGWEKRADANKEFLTQKKKDYYGKQGNTNNRPSTVNDEVPISHEGNNKTYNGNRELGQRTSREESLGDTSTSIQGTVGEPKQLQLDFTSTEQAIDNLATGKAEIKQVSDVDAIVTKAAEIDPEVSGTTWEAIAKDADKYADFLSKAEDFGLDVELKDALTMNDVTKMDAITRKVLAAQKLTSQAADKLVELGDNPPFEEMKKIMDLIDQISRYTKETGSASGRNLQARKFINRAVETFGSLRMSQLTQAGINDLADLLTADINKTLDMNFTRGMSLEEMKSELMSNWLKNADSPFVQMILNDKEIAVKFDEILEKVLKSNGKVNIGEEIFKAITEADYRAAYNATKLTSDPNTKVKVIKNWVDKQGGLTSFYVHNLLSGVGTLAKNVVSGGMNTLYFPLKKIIAGYMGGGASMTREGINTYKNMLTSWKEALSLGSEAFLNGEGKLSMMRDTMALDESEVFNGFRDWEFDWTTPQGIWYGIQNFHSVMTRAMGASDEFMSQLNYRAIKRAKAIEQADQVANMYKITDEDTKNQIADSIFKSAFDKEGRPLDVEALAEAKDILYQLPLNGEVFDRTTGEMTKVREKSWTTGLAQNLNQAAANNPLLKIMFPFVKTGANILQQNLEHNAVYGVFSTNQRQLLMSNTKEGALARSQVAFGMFSFMAAAGMAMNGAITGSAPADQKERQALFETGWKPYSFRVGNKYISYQGYEPIQTILGFAADSVNLGANVVTSDDEAKWEKFTQQIMSTAINNFIDKAAFRTGLRQLAALTSPDEDNIEKFKQTLAQTTQGFLPDSSFVRNTSSVGNRDLTSPKGFYERVFNNYFNRGLGDYRRDVFGNRQDMFGLTFLNIAPDNGNQPEYAELEYLSQFGFSPSDIRKEIVGTGLKYTNFKDPETNRSVYDAMQEELSTLDIGGKTLQEAVRELVTSQEYQDLPLGVNMNDVKYSSSEDTKLNAIRELFVEYNNEALNNVVRDFGDVYVDRKGRTMSEAVEEVQLEKLNQSIQQNLNDNITNQILQFGQ